MRWTAEEDAALRRLYSTHTRVEMAIILGRTEGMIRSRCWTLRLATKIAPWTAKEVESLRATYAAAPPLKLAELARRLGRDTTNICRKARDLGLTDQHRRKVAERKRRRKFDTEEELRQAKSATQKAWIAANGHPRGALGMVHSAETRARLSAASRAMWANPLGKHNAPEFRQQLSDRLVQRVAAGEMRSGGFSRCASGRRPDLDNLFVRSAWEANYARYLNLRLARGELQSWKYEAKTFVFEAIKRGTRAYTPDFLLVFPDGRHEWHEVKGWMDPASATRLKRMAKYFPEEVVRVIDETWFRHAVRSGLAAVIPNWERPGRNRIAKARGL